MPEGEKRPLLPKRRDPCGRPKKGFQGGKKMRLEEASPPEEQGVGHLSRSRGGRARERALKKNFNGLVRLSACRTAAIPERTQKGTERRFETQKLRRRAPS